MTKKEKIGRVVAGVAMVLIFGFFAIMFTWDSSSQKVEVKPEKKIEVVKPKPVKPVAPKINPNDVKVDADGEYQNITLPCGCGSLTIYIPGSCVCFDKANNPKIDDATEKVFDWLMERKLIAGDKKPVGKYESKTLKCGCTLYVYVPGSSGCLKSRYPDLEALLNILYKEACGDQEQPAPKPVIKDPPVVKCCVLAFEASWCGPCQAAKPKIVAARMRGLDIRDFDIDAYPGLAKQWNITAVPTFVVLKGGKEELRTHDPNVVVGLLP